MENKLIIDNCNGASREWDSGFPIGNGRMGAMIQGWPGFYDITVLNHDTLWYGPHRDRDNRDAIKYVPKIRQLLKEGNVKEADKLCYTAMTSVPKYFGAYEPMGSLYVWHNDDCGKKRGPYTRELDLETAIVHVQQETDGINRKREYFVSYPDQVFIYRMTASEPVLDIHTNIMRRPYDMGCDFPEENVIHMNGQCGPDGVSFSCCLSAQTDGKLERIGDSLAISNASEITLFITSSSDFYEENHKEAALAQLRAAMEKSYEELKARHIADYQSLYSRSRIDFESQNAPSMVDRMNDLRSGKTDSGLLELMVNYAKYLMISCSRPGSQASNLQGIWNNNYAAPWECNYTVNINTEANYWIAESTGLSDCHLPLFDLIDRMVPNGERTAKTVYGCEGFVSHHTTNLWGDTSIEGNSFPSSVWPMGGAWLALHLWEHYAYTQDKEFLEKRAFPVLKKAARFFCQYLDKSDDGYYMTGPSLSPENPYWANDNYVGRHCMAPEIDNQILRALFRSVLNSYEILGIHDEEEDIFKTIMAGIRPIRINQYGAILEWDKDYKESDVGHRHLSPLFGLFPDYQIKPDRMPEIAKACETTLKRRFTKNDKDSDFVIAWGDAWAAACYARLGNGEKAAYHMYRVLTVMSNSLLSNKHYVPCIQIEASFAGAAAILEMILGSDDEKIMLLPALPADIPAGSFQGLRSRGGFEVDAKWRDGKLYAASITSLSGNPCRIKAANIAGVNTEHTFEDGMLVFDTKAGETYQLLFD